MRNALFECAAYRSSKIMSAEIDEIAPQMGDHHGVNLTTFDPRPHKCRPPSYVSVQQVPTPQLTLRQYHQEQYSPAATPSPGLEKRVRRKPSFTSIARATEHSKPLPVAATSYRPQTTQNSVRTLLPSLLPPTPSTPRPPTSASSPSLSSTVDTLPSTPSHTPLLRSSLASRRWFQSEEDGLSEPIRTKRKLTFKQAKRLPHPAPAQHAVAAGGGVWQVHAAIIEVPGGDSSSSGESSGCEPQVTRGRVDAEAETSSSSVTGPEIGERRARTVRFEETAKGEGLGLRVEEAHSQATDTGLTSSFSLSNFKFPAPPGHNWTGTFGKLTSPYAR